MEGGGFFPFGRRPRGDPARAARVRRDAVRERQGGTARAVRDADAQHRRRADRGGAEAGAADGAADEQAVALRDAMRVLFPEAVALVSAARQGFMRESLAICGSGVRPRSRRLRDLPAVQSARGHSRPPWVLFDRAVAAVLPAVPRSLVRRVSAPYIAGADARRRAPRRRRAQRRRASGRRSTCSARRCTRPQEAEAIAAAYDDALAAIDSGRPRRQRLGQADRPRAEGRPRACAGRCSRGLVRDAGGARRLRPDRHGGRVARRTTRSRSTASLRGDGYDNVGIVLQADLRRTLDRHRGTCATSGRACGSARASTSSRRRSRSRSPR